MALNPEISKIARQQIGGYLRDIRKHKKLSIKEVAELTGTGFKTVQSIETGSTNYTIDAFLAYVQAVDCYFYLADKGGKHLDADGLIDKINKPI
jgi:transcriptional regulator with XRE-family HTH domain